MHPTVSQVLACVASLQAVAWAAPSSPHSQPLEHLKRQANATESSDLQVDLGYEIYEGYHNATADINYWKGIRFAAPPLGDLRWQAPQLPAVDRSNVISASDYGPICPQSPNGGTAPEAYGDEDCLVLNVWAPPNAQGLPVLVWIHGGGYGQGNGQEDLTYIINENGNNFIGVAIQYRLGAFGFLSSDEVFRRGAVNAGILDQTFALKWVQTYIHLFGGDPTQVTISGESAGGGSVMLQTMAYGGTLGKTLFQNAFSSSPYLPMQYGYGDWVPSQSYYAFASRAGCFGATAYGYQTRGDTIFDCLINKDTQTLQNASFFTSASANYGIWGFLPVTDGVFIQDLPSTQLAERRVNGQRLLVGNNAEEGAPFVSQNITTESDLVTWLQLTFPLFSNSDIAKVLLYYPTGNASVNSNADEYATSGYTGANANNQSAVATGQQQRANNIYSETTFICPSYWMAQAFSDPPRTSYRYQYSVVPALHGNDVSAYFGPVGAAENQGPDFVRAFMHIVGNFVTQNDPSISSAIANGASASNNSVSANAASTWPPFDIYAPYQINLNQTGGTEISTDTGIGEGNSTIYVSPGLQNDFTLANAYTWEGGRGYRCDFWRSVGAIVPG
ncbi:hypothetical protein LTR37_006536 [Vermiconidia calcicola]|uniref:Uncharacterized protein n=1 Tax=Vermiconidia calcicola TaxID=1690605 RepID=A0ACC3NG35_9PEZI|nr:hypothetical protein LTR37_006536 [Vermiconidia calcicola]